MVKARLPAHGEATGYGATYVREIDCWSIYWMPGAVPLGVSTPGFQSRDTADFLLTALRSTIESKEGQSYD